MSFFECFNCGGAIGVFCRCKEPALSEKHANEINAKNTKKEEQSDNSAFVKTIISKVEDKESVDKKSDNQTSDKKEYSESEKRALGLFAMMGLY